MRRLGEAPADFVIDSGVLLDRSVGLRADRHVEPPEQMVRSVTDLVATKLDPPELRRHQCAGEGRCLPTSWPPHHARVRW